MADDEASPGVTSSQGSNETPNQAQNIERSPAFSFLEAHAEAGELSQADAQFYKAKYKKLHEYVLLKYEREKELLKGAKQLNQDLLGEKIKLGKLTIRRHDEMQAVGLLEKERDKGSKELTEVTEKDAMLQYGLAEVGRECEDLRDELNVMRKANSDLVEPELKKMQEACNQLENELGVMNAACDVDKKLKNDLIQHSEALHEDKTKLVALILEEKQTVSKLKTDPARIKKQSDVVHKAVENMRIEIERAGSKIATSDHDLADQSLKRKELVEVGKDITRKLELHRATIQQREREVDEVGLSLEMECTTHQDLLTRRVEMDLLAGASRSRFKEANDELVRGHKEFETEKRKLKKRIQQCDTLKATLPQLKLQLNDGQHLAASYKTENKQLKQKLHELQQEVDIYIASYLSQETTEKSKRSVLERNRTIVKELEHQISLWSVEEAKQAKQISLLSAQREIKARDASRALQHERETKEDLRIKELVMMDLTKKCNETNNRLREFSALYDIVKNERNKYVNLIQASSQALAEMKEKIKILHNEVEILRNESLAKDRALAKERLAHHTAQCQRDSARLETNKCNATYRQKQEQVEQQIVEIDKLNSIINQMEREMLHLKKQYEQAVENRNMTGVYLVDRNDELCILYEKSNLQTATRKRGEIELQMRNEDIRMLKLQIAQAAHKMQSTRKGIPEMPILAKQILELKRELAAERETAEELSAKLETPDNPDRWRPLKGDDPDMEQLSAKVEVLEERLNERKEQVLERELVLEEVTGLANKLKDSAQQGKQETIKLAVEVNEFQARIKELNKRMMAVVSELSMYQATAIKLQQEKDDRHTQVQEALQRLHSGQAPSYAASREWIGKQHAQQRLRSALGKAQQRRVKPPMAKGVRTTAEPRPNAYVPVQAGIPRPYGGMAPFKPSELGSSIRHIRQPKSLEIEI